MSFQKENSKFFRGGGTVPSPRRRLADHKCTTILSASSFLPNVPGQVHVKMMLFHLHARSRVQMSMSHCMFASGLSSTEILFFLYFIFGCTVNTIVQLAKVM